MVASAHAIFINLYEVAERHRKEGISGGSEWIDAERILEASNKHGKAKRVEAAIGEYELITKRRESDTVLPRHLLHLLHYGDFY